MVKLAPEVIAGEKRIEQSAARMRTDLAMLSKLVDADKSNMGNWLKRQAFYWRRRYAYENRQVNTPWPGASNVVYPMEDMQIGQGVPPLHGALLGKRHVASLIPLATSSPQATLHAELALENMLRGGGVTAIPDFEEQVTYALDAAFCLGRGILRPYLAYRTAERSQTLHSHALPGMLSTLMVMPGLDDRDRDGLAQGNPAAIREYALALGISDDAALQTVALANRPEILDWLGTHQPLNRAAFKMVRDRIAASVVREFGLDEDLPANSKTADPTDAKALDEILDWIGAGFPGSKLTVRTREVLRHGPAVANVSCFDLFVPSGTRNDLSRADRITERCLYTEADLLAFARDHDLPDDAVDQVLAKSKLIHGLSVTQEEPPRHDSQRALASSGHEQALYEVYWTWHRSDLHGDRAPEMRVTVWGKGCTEMPLLDKEDDSLRGAFPHVVLPLEFHRDGYFDSRPVGQILRDASSYMTSMYRGIDNQITLTVGPYFKARKTMFIDPETYAPTPGSVVGILRPDDFSVETAPTNMMPMERYMAMFQHWPERLVGTVDIASTQPQRHFEPRTQFEVSSIVRQQQGVVGMRARLMFGRFRQVIQKCWDMLQVYGPPSWWISVAGREPEVMTRARIQGDYQVVLKIAAADMDPDYRYQRALARFQVMQQLAADPRVSRDPRFVLDITQAGLDVLYEDDPEAAARLLVHRSAEEQRQIAERDAAEAQRAAVLADVARRLAVNAGIGRDEAATILREVRALSPHKGMTVVTATAEEAEAQIQQVAALIQQEAAERGP